MVVCPVVTSPNQLENKVIARLSTSFLPHRQFWFSRLEFQSGAGPVPGAGAPDRV